MGGFSEIIVIYPLLNNVLILVILRIKDILGINSYVQVCAAVAFGVGLGLKEGVGPASEYFAGYVELLSLES